MSTVLPTLLSRALVLQFHALGPVDMTSYIQTAYPALDHQDVIITLAQGRPGLVSLFVDLLDSVPSAFMAMESVIRSGDIKDKYAFYKALSVFQKAGVVDIVLDALIAHFVDKKMYPFVQDWLYIKKNLESNVSFENLALRMLTH